MRAWMYALKDGIRAIIVVELALIVSSAVVFVFYKGLVSPPGQLLTEVGKIAAIGALIVFPAAVVSKRYQVWRNNQVKPK